nr:MAG TPA: hypothetical protein [Caudoviricetes sp.]
MSLCSESYNKAISSRNPPKRVSRKLPIAVGISLL